VDLARTGRRWFAVTALVVIGAAVLLVTQGRASTATSLAVPGSARVESMLHGIPQHGAWLGRMDAPVTVVEYVDVQCPYCARFSRDVFPTVVTKYVRPGRVRVLFRGLAFVGPDSAAGLRWVVAAGRQNRLWNLLELLYANQGRENSGWLRATRLESFVHGVPGLKLVTLRHDSRGAAVAAQIRLAAAAAKAADVPGTPYFQAGRSLVALSTLQLRSWNPSDFGSQLDELFTLQLALIALRAG
jgi:protein-disulfide isomerase